MAEAPASLEHLAGRTFAFYPPILNVEHNEWQLRNETWAEILVQNAKGDIQVWIPRRYVGEISSIEDPVTIVGLLRELEYKAGTVWPHERRVLEMPVAGAQHDETAALAAGTPKKLRIAGIPDKNSPESRAGRLLAKILIGMVALVVVGLALIELGRLRPVKFTAADQDFLSLSRTDDYFDVVKKLGKPAEDRWRESSKELDYRVLWYPQRSYYVVLLGADRNSAHFIGVLDKNWRVVYYVDLPGGGDYGSLLRALPRF
jgi:hypothetical protein